MIDDLLQAAANMIPTDITLQTCAFNLDYISLAVITILN